MGLLERDAKRFASMKPAPKHRARVAGAYFACQQIEQPLLEIVGFRVGLEPEPDDRSPPLGRGCAFLERHQVVEEMGFARSRWSANPEDRTGYLKQDSR